MIAHLSQLVNHKIWFSIIFFLNLIAFTPANAEELKLRCHRPGGESVYQISVDTISGNYNIYLNGALKGKSTVLGEKETVLEITPNKIVLYSFNIFYGEIDRVKGIFRRSWSDSSTEYPCVKIGLIEIARPKF